MNTTRLKILFYLIIWVGACALLSGLTGCRGDGYTRVVRAYKVVSLGDCTEATSNWLAGVHSGKCRVVLDDGSHETMHRPVMVGDLYERVSYEPLPCLDKVKAMLEGVSCAP
jgi:hypothetical protein